MLRVIVGVVAVNVDMGVYSDLEICAMLLVLRVGVRMALARI